MSNRFHLYDQRRLPPEERDEVEDPQYTAEEEAWMAMHEAQDRAFLAGMYDEPDPRVASATCWSDVEEGVSR